MTATDRDVVRALGQQVAEIAALPVHRETIERWKALNRLDPVRPMVLVNHIPWHEINVDDELTLQTTHPFCRHIEAELRRTLYAWRHMRTDRVVEPFIRLPRRILGVSENLGLEPVEERVAVDAANPIVGHHYHDQFQTEDDLERIQVPEVALDRDATTFIEERACELLDGVLGVRMEGHFPRFTVWDRIVEWRGAETTLLELAVNPEFMHRLARRATDAYLARLDQLEAKGLLGYGQAIVKNSGAYTDELPASGFDAARPRAADIWSSGMGQIFASASPRMHREFELDYACEWYGRFGLNYYGCCEPLHDRIDDVSRIPNLRKISMSPWTDQERGAEAIGGRFVFSRKPNPAFLADGSWSAERVREDLCVTRDICRRHNCPVEFILQDLSTVSYRPDRLWAWVEIAMDVAAGG